MTRRAILLALLCLAASVSLPQALLADAVQILSVVPPNDFCPGETITVTYEVEDDVNAELDAIGAFSSGATLAPGNTAFLYGTYTGGSGACPGPTEPVLDSPIFTPNTSEIIPANLFNQITGWQKFTAVTCIPAGLPASFYIDIGVRENANGGWDVYGLDHEASLGPFVSTCTQGYVMNTADSVYAQSNQVALLLQACANSPTPTPTDTETRTFTPTFTFSQTSTPTATPSQTNTATPSATPSATPTQTRTATPSVTFTSTSSLTATPTFTSTLTPSPTLTDTVTLGPSPTSTPTYTATSTATPTLTSSDSPTATPSATSSDTATSSPTMTPTWTATPSATPSDTSTSSPTMTPTWTVTPTSTDSPIYSPTPTPTFTATCSDTATFSDTMTETSSPTFTLTSTPTPTPSATPTASPTPSASNTYSATPTDTPSASVTMTSTLTLTFTNSPTRSPTPSVTQTPIPVPFQLSVDVYNEAGELVKTVFSGTASILPGTLGISSQAFSTGSGTGVPIGLPGYFSQNGVQSSNGLNWNMTNSAAQTVESGVYYIKAQYTDSFGRITTLIQSVQVIDTQSQNTLEIYNSSGEVVWQQNLSGNYPAQIVNMSLPSGSSAFAPEYDSNGNISSTPLQIQGLDSQGQSYTIPWNGKNNQGQPVTSGSYIIQLTSSSANGAPLVVSKPVTVIETPNNITLSGSEVGPNPVMPGFSSIVITYPASSNLAGVAEIYDLAGELAVQGSDPLGSGRIQVNIGKLAGGIYIIELEKMSGSQVVVRQALKLAVVK